MLWRMLPQAFRESRAVRALRVAARRVRGIGSEEDERYFRYVEETTAASVKPIADSIIKDYAPARVFDAGCGTGIMLDYFRSRGVQVSGVEYSFVALRYCRQRKLAVEKCDLSKGLSPTGRSADVAICVEVAHQLPAASGERLVTSLCKIAPVVVFSANTPGSGDRVRMNLQPHEWWIERFARNGFQLNQAVTDRWRGEWRQAGVAEWFCSNTLVFERGVPEPAPKP